MRCQRSDGSTLGHQRNPSRLRTTRRAAIKQTTHRGLTRWLKLHEVGFTSALSQNLFVLEVDATSASSTKCELTAVGRPPQVTAAGGPSVTLRITVCMRQHGTKLQLHRFEASAVTVLRIRSSIMTPYAKISSSNAHELMTAVCPFADRIRRQ